MNAILDVGRLRLLMESQGINQKELAVRSGVSRVQVNRLLAHTSANVRETTLQRLAQGLGVAPVELSKGGRLEQFRQFVAEENATLDFRGIGMPQFERQPIEDIFVDLTVREDIDTTDGCRETSVSQNASRPVRRANRHSSQPLPAGECIQTVDRVVVLGHPGSGKTTLLRSLAHSHAIRSGEQAELPIYIRLPEFCRAQEIDARVDLVQFIAARAADSGCADVKESLTKELSDEKCRCLVLLDGLDEVGDHDQKKRLIKSVKEFIEIFPKNRFVVTSRIVGFDSSPWTSDGFTMFRVLGYSREQLRTFAEQWAKLLSRIQGQPQAEVLEDLETAIFSNPRVRALASNPLILTILILLSSARGGALPRRRVDLYEKVVDVFLDTWEKSKRATEKFDETYSINLDAREFRWLLSDVSLAMQKAEQTLAPRWWLVDKMREYLQQKLGFESKEANDVCDRILRYLTERTGLIEERGLDLFGFSHRTLQEYLASLAIIDEADASNSKNVTDCLRGYYFHPQWCEVVRLVAARLTPPRAESLVSSILDDPDPVGRFLKRGPLLALKCLTDGTTVANRLLVSNIFSSLVELGRSKWIGITLEAIDVLEDFSGTRLECYAKEAIASILDTAKSELDDDEYDFLYERIHRSEIFERATNELPQHFESQAAREVVIEYDGKTRKKCFLNAMLLSNKPDQWHDSACLILKNPQQSERLKKLLVYTLSRNVATSARVRFPLRKILRSKAPSGVRVACASALAAMTKGRHNTKQLLLRTLKQDKDEQVRHACAAALSNVAADDFSVREKLLEIFEGDEPIVVRSGAARGLSKAAISDRSLTKALLCNVLKDSEPVELRFACAWTLKPQIGENEEISEAFKKWLDEPAVRHVAAQALAVKMADESIPWEHQIVEKIEHILMNLDDPCPHALESLNKLATAREVRSGLRLENVLRDSLQPACDRIELAFVFGSTARNRQTQDSDIDLLLIGDVRLKELSSPLRDAERTLGRRINPAIYSRDVFQQKYQSGDPFLLDVYRREKIPVINSSTLSSRRDLDDELRAMVSEQMASAI